MLQTNAKVFQRLRTVSASLSLAFLNPRINMHSIVYTNAMSACVILVLLGLCKCYSILYRQTLENFKWEKMLSCFWRDPDNIHIVYSEMSWKRRLFVGTLRYYTLHIFLSVCFFRFSFFGSGASSQF